MGRKRCKEQDKLGFDDLVLFLKDNGYNSEVSYVEGYSNQKFPICSVTGMGIYGAFSVQNEDTHRYLNNAFAADNKKCFDKWSKCPLVMKLPCDANLLLKHLKYLGSKEGLKISESYAYYDSYPWPIEVV